MEDKLQFRPLGKLKNIIENIGTEISYVHDDLVFVEHSAFLLQFDDECENNLFLHFNIDCETKARRELSNQIQLASEREGFTISKGSNFILKQLEGKEEIQIEFT